MRVRRKISVLMMLACGFATAIHAQDSLQIMNLTLDKAIEIALSENPTIKVAGEEIQLKKSSRKEAILGLLPTVSLTGSYTRTIEKQTMVMNGMTFKVGVDNVYNGGLTASLPVFAPSLYQSIGLTKKDVELALEKSRESKLTLVNSVSKAYYQLMLAQDSYEVLQKSYKQSEDNYNVVNSKYEQGSVSEYDKISAEVQMRSIKPSVISARNAVRLATLQLKVLMGVTSDISITTQEKLNDYEGQMYADLMKAREINLDGNTTLRQLDLNKQMLMKTVKLRKSAFLPTLALSFNYVYITMASDFKFKDYDWNPYSTVGLTFSMPLYKASNFTQLKQAKLQLSQLEYTGLNTRRQLNMQATSYIDNMSASSEQVSSNKEAVAQAQKGRVIAEKRYEVGKGTILELNGSEVSLTQAQLTYNQSIYDFLTAKSDLDLVLGTNEQYNK